MLFRHTPLSANDLRQCLRIATGGAIGFTICKIFALSNGVFFTVTPMLLLGLSPVLTGHTVRQAVAAAVMSGIEVGLIAGLFGGHPGLMIPIVFVMFLYRFAAMARGHLFLFGANGVLNLSVMLHFASYPDTNVNELIFANFWATLLAVAIAGLMMLIWPDIEPRPKQKPLPKAPNRIRHETLMGATIATISFMVFQVFDLRDSMSAQATTILLLYPMNWNGSLDYARKRAIGTVLGVLFGISAQLFLYDWSGLLILVVPLLWIGLMLFSQLHVKENKGSGVGFGAMTTLGILFGQYLSPGNDLVFSALYRVSSIFVAILATLLLCYLVHRILNSFQATRFTH
ncbi:1,4-alpha-glucan branching protein [Vibrio sp. 10N.286.49.B3]|uniref:DUF2955 domain-containing protein n=1 Tax=Vibrio sp. 10N.286.49.B3 TaxID=1880855 RepID=UPI000C824AB3|nr:DUF2955 domain-containing protein [Vibrio sp. 10N.286.49.B3]PMH44818.1 1,4-alpha-glucan branching protein [Vibrio sp. 10N.286.49.B3]